MKIYAAISEGCNLLMVSSSIDYILDTIEEPIMIEEGFITYNEKGESLIRMDDMYVNTFMNNTIKEYITKEGLK